MLTLCKITQYSFWKTKWAFGKQLFTSWLRCFFFFFFLIPRQLSKADKESRSFNKARFIPHCLIFTDA